MTVDSYTRWSRRLLPVLIFVATVTVFVPSLDSSFVNWDDDKNLLDNPYFRGLGPAQLFWMWTSHLMGHYIPITWMSLGLDYVLWGLDPFGYHLTNLILHAANAVLFYFVALSLLRMSDAPGPEKKDWGRLAGAAFAALVFALHPFRVESVVWTTERRDVLCGLFWLLAVMAYLRALGQDRSRKYYVACLIFFVLALLSKEMAVTLPAVFLVLDVYPLRRLGGGRGRWIGPAVRSVWVEKIPFALLSLACAAVTWRVSVAEGVTTSLSQEGWLDRIEISIYGLAFYIRKTLAPFNLSPMYVIAKWKFDPAGRSFLLSALIVLGITTIAIMQRRKYPALLAAWLVYGLTLLPVVGITQNGRQIAADRYSYLPCLGWALCAGALVEICWRRLDGKKTGQSLVLGTGALVLAFLSFLTLTQAQIWSDSETLWRYVISKEPTPLAYENLGTALCRAGECRDAISYFRQGLALSPDDPDVNNDIGVALLSLGLRDEAMLHFQTALRSNPRLFTSHYGLGQILSSQGQFDSAIEEFQAALRLKPDYEAAGRGLNQAIALKRSSGH